MVFHNTYGSWSWIGGHADGERDLERVALRESGGRISGEYIYIYPPGIPIVAPGEEISGEALDLVLRFMEQGLPVQGPQYRALEWLLVVRQNIDR